MRMPDYDSFFAAYADFYNAAVEGKPVIGDLRHCYGDYVVGASPGSIMGGKNDEDYGKVMEQGFAFYRSIGMKRMLVRGVEASEIMAGHDLVHVDFRAELERRDGSPLQVDFSVAYVTQRHDSGPKIFAFISDDQMTLFRELGLVDEEGRPV